MMDKITPPEEQEPDTSQFPQHVVFETGNAEAIEGIPVPGQQKGQWLRLLKRWWGAIAGIAFLIFSYGAKLKVLLLLLTKVKFATTAFTMVVSIGAYALLFPLWFAVGLVLLLLIHETGHVLQLRREGIKATAPMFIPFMGAVVGMKEMPKDAAAEARVGLAGPIIGTLGAIGAWGLYILTDNLLFLGLAYVGFFINLFNLLPMLPLDGGRAAGALSPVFWIFGLIAALAYLVVNPNPIILFILIIGGIELWNRWRARNTEEGQEYYKVSPGQRFAIGSTYLGMILLLGLFMSMTFLPDPIAVSEGVAAAPSGPIDLGQ